MILKEKSAVQSSEIKVGTQKSVYRKLPIVVVLLSVVVGGCSYLSGPDETQQERTEERGSEEKVIEKDIPEKEKDENPLNTDISDEEEIKSYIIPETIWNVTGMSAEEQAESFRQNNIGQRRFKKVEVNEEDALVLTMTEKQKDEYANEIAIRINEDIKDAEEQEDIYIKLSEDYSTMKMTLGENSSSTGFQRTFIILTSEVGVSQILNGCVPDEWGFHLIVEREEEIILDVDVPDDKWVLTNEDFGE